MEKIKQERLEEYIALQKTLTLKKNQEKIGQKLFVLIEKESKKSKDQWAGRTEGNSWVIFDKSNENIKDIVPISITDARGISLFGKKEYSGGNN